MNSDSQLEHDGQAPARRPPDDTPDLRKQDEFDAPGEGEVDHFTRARGEDHATARQLKLPGVEDVPSRPKPPE